MSAAHPLEKALSARERLVFFILATGLFVLPIILADYPYVDDHLRLQLLAATAWKEQGRILIEFFYSLLTFTHGTPNIFPLPLLVGTLAISLALARLSAHYFKAPTYAQCLVVLPLWYNPLFLGNLTYQYDGPAMALSMAAVIYAIVYCGRSLWRTLLIPGALIAVAISLYQVSINVFVGLVCIELIRVISRQETFKTTAGLMAQKVLQLLIGLVAYQFSAARFITDQRQALLPLNADGLGQIEARLALVADRIGLFFNAGNLWFSLLLLVVAAFGLLLLVRQVLSSPERVPGKVGLLLLLSAAVAVLLLAVSGIMLVFGEFSVEARTLMGFSTLLVAIFLLSQQVLNRLHPRLVLFLLVPLLCMLSFAYAYGRVLVMQKQLEQTILHELSYDINSSKALQGVGAIYLLTPDTAESWLPNASRTLTALPALRYILSLDFFVLPEAFPSVGITNVYWGDDQALATAKANGSATQLVDNTFYTLYLVDQQGYIVMKTIHAAEAYEQ